MADEGRRQRVAQSIHTTIARLLEGRIKDPRLGFVTITEVRVTKDLQHANVFYTVLGDQSDRESSAAALKSASGLLRSHVGKNLGLRLTPSLDFTLDALPDTAKSMEEALAKARQADEELAKRAASAQYAAGVDPYKKPREQEENQSDIQELEDDQQVTEAENLEDTSIEILTQKSLDE